MMRFGAPAMSLAEDSRRWPGSWQPLPDQGRSGIDGRFDTLHLVLVIESRIE
jgi:hypothetical protein